MITTKKDSGAFQRSSIDFADENNQHQRRLLIKLKDPNKKRRAVLQSRGNPYNLTASGQHQLRDSTFDGLSERKSNFQENIQQFSPDSFKNSTVFIANEQNTTDSKWYQKVP